VRPSTAIELAGFGLIVFAVYSWNPLAGLALAGLVLLVIGYVFEDDKAAVTVARMIHPIVRRWELRNIRRQAKRSQ
jgi:hypothetical protein